MRLPKSQMRKRKRRRYVMKPIRQAWRIYLQQLIREYRHGG